MNIDFDFACRDDCLDQMVPSDLRVLVSERDAAQAEIERLRGLLTMVCEGFDLWEEPTPGETAREWSSQFSTYLHGNVVARGIYTPEEWAQIMEGRGE